MFWLVSRAKKLQLNHPEYLKHLSQLNYPRSSYVSVAFAQGSTILDTDFV